MAWHYFIDAKCEGVPHEFEAVTRGSASEIVHNLRSRWAGKTWNARVTVVRVTRSNAHEVIEYSAEHPGGAPR